MKMKGRKCKDIPLVYNLEYFRTVTIVYLILMKHISRKKTQPPYISALKKPNSMELRIT
jgi:hypothetical protein